MTIHRNESPDVVQASRRSVFGHTYLGAKYIAAFGGALITLLTLIFMVPKGFKAGDALFSMPATQQRQVVQLDTLTAKLDRVASHVDHLDDVCQHLAYWQDTVQKNRNSIMKAQPVMIDIEQRLKAVEHRHGLGFYPDSEKQFMAEYFTKQP